MKNSLEIEYILQSVFALTSNERTSPSSKAFCPKLSPFFKNQFGENYKEYLYFSFISTAFCNSKIFNTINTKMISKTFGHFSFRSLKNNEVVYPKGQKVTEKLSNLFSRRIMKKI